MPFYAKGSLGRAVTVLAIAGMLGGAYADRIVRFNDSWKFNRGDVSGAQAPSYSDASWQTVYLPHADSILLNTNTSSYYLGYCWYRKTFTPDASMQGKKLFLEIEAAMQAATIYVNGDSLTTHLGGYTPIILDITSHINFAGSNVIAARLNNNANAAFPPGMTSDSIDFLYFGGLYRNVYLHVADSLHITNPILANIPAGGGIFVTNSAVTTGAATASVYVKTNLLNEYKSSQSCKLVTTIFNASGQTVAKKTDSTVLATGGSTTFADTLAVAGPQLWTPATPNLYSVVSQIYDNGHLADSCSLTFGIRTISFSKANGLQINGQRLKLHGADRHQSFPYIGNALPNSGQYRDALRMKRYGYDFVRMCHYGQAQAFFNACDQLGIAAIVCLPGWYYTFNTTAFINNSLAALRDMVRYYRNHPSVILWESMWNESTPTVAFLDSAEALVHREFPGNQTFTCGEESNGILDVYISSS
ncbi:MAG: glycoside hydrolase family 2 TIM barrel-domain containing protein, partial [Chitinispirillaceae bacterium]